MKNTLPLFLVSMVICGCSQKRAPSALQASDLVAILVPTNVFIKCRDGYVLYAGSRSGTAFQNITVYKTASDGSLTSIHADTGTILPASDGRSVKVKIQDAESASGSNAKTNIELMLVLP